MLKLRSALNVFFAGTLASIAVVAYPQSFPDHPIRIMNPAGGSASDLTARLIAQGISGPLGQQVVVENRPGTIPAEIVSKAAPDGYTLLLDGGRFWIASLLQKVPYEVLRDYTPISTVTNSLNVIVVHPSMPVHSVKDLIKLAKANPGQLNYTSGSTGAMSHLAGELFNSMAGVKIIRIPYSNGNLEVADWLSGQVPLSFAGAGTATPYVKAGRLRAIAVTSTQPSALFPGLPTIASQGLPGYEATSIRGIVAPAKTSAAVINRLNQEIVRYLNRPEVKSQFVDVGLEAVSSSPDELAGWIKSEIAKWGKVIKDAGIKGD